VQERFELSRYGRVALSLFVAFTVVSLAFWNMPNGHLKSGAVKVVRPFVIWSGLDQTWSVFAPDPRRDVIDFEAQIAYANGKREVWRMPDGDPFVGDYRAYHWQKLMESGIQDAKKNELWEPLAAWIARTHRHAGKVPVEVVLVRRFYTLSQPGTHPIKPRYKVVPNFTYKVPK
jgi:hypothetical protein